MIQTVQTDQAPAPVGPYSQAVVAQGKTLYLAGQIPLNPASGAIESEDAAEQTRQCLRNIGAILKAAGGDYGSLAKVTVYTTDIGEFAAINRAYAEFFAAGRYPARVVVEVSALPRSARVEIEAVACL